MGKAARLKRERALGQRRGRPLSLVFCDVDFERGSRAHGRGVPAAPPEGWVIGRAGLVHARWDGEQLRIIGDELITGLRPASALVEALRSTDLVVGHGFLTGDLRVAAMVTDVPDSLLSRTVDTLALAHRLRGGKMPTGCNLSALATANLDASPTKQRVPVPHRGLPTWQESNRGDPSPACGRSGASRRAARCSARAART